MTDRTPLLLDLVDRIASDGLSVGFADATGLEAPYVVVWPLGEDPAEGPATPDGRFADRTVRVQTTAVAASARGACELAARVDGLVTGSALGAPLVVGGLRVHVRHDQSLGLTPDDDVEPPVWVVSTRWSYWTTPTA